MLSMNSQMIRMIIPGFNADASILHNRERNVVARSVLRLEMQGIIRGPEGCSFGYDKCVNRLIAAHEEGMFFCGQIEDPGQARMCGEGLDSKFTAAEEACNFMWCPGTA